MLKKCVTCKEDKDLSEFHKNKNEKDGLYTQCKYCVQKRDKKYRQKNRESILKQKKEYYQKVKVLISEHRKSKEYRDIINIKKKQRKETDPLYKMKCTISNLIYNSIKNKKFTKKSKSFEILGCSYEHFREHIENQFTDGMSWENAGEWHYDHIYPVSLAKTEEELIKLNHYTNFQPLWAKDNLSKSNKII